MSDPDFPFDPSEDLHPKQQIAFGTPATEILYGGAAGGGKSHLMRYFAVVCALLMPGIQIYLFRRTSPDLLKNHVEGPNGLPAILAPLIAMGRVKYNMSKGIFTFPGGSKIFLCHCQYEKDVASYQGAEIHLLLMDELTHFTAKIYKQLRGRCRLGAWRPPEQYRGLFPRILCGSNPGGIGHNWVKGSFVTSAPAMQIWKTKRKDGGMYRQYIPALLDDNPTMTENDPDYKDRLYGLGDPALVKAMLEGDWDIVSGAALDDVWKTLTHMIEAFDVPYNWYVDRSFDWGSTAPFSVGWWAESNGEEVKLKSGKKKSYHKGSLIRINEWYGWNGEANEGCKMLATHIAQGIKQREAAMGLHVRPGPADSSIYTSENGNCIADDMAAEGVHWTKADKSPGSRVNGLEKVREMLSNSLQSPMEKPGMFAFEHCTHFRRTLPVIPRDEKKRDDVDTASEDHLYDDVRYRVTMPRIITTVQEV
jgi:hypothetical protein